MQTTRTSVLAYSLTRIIYRKHTCMYVIPGMFGAVVAAAHVGGARILSRHPLDKRPRPSRLLTVCRPFPKMIRVQAIEPPSSWFMLPALRWPLPSRLTVSPARLPRLDWQLSKPCASPPGATCQRTCCSSASFCCSTLLRAFARYIPAYMTSLEACNAISAALSAFCSEYRSHIDCRAI